MSADDAPIDPQPNDVPDEPDTPPGHDQLPADHPLVKTLAAQKAQIKELKGKAARLDEIDEAAKSDLQKAIDRAEQAERRASEVEARATRAEVASEKGVPAALLTGSTREELEASADALLAFRGEQKTPPPDFGGGKRGDDVGGKGSQLSREDVKKLYAEGKHAEIEQARKEGRLDKLLTNT